MTRRTSSESETTALSQQPDDAPDAVAETAADTGPAYKVAEVLDGNVAVIELENGSMFHLPFEGDRPRRGSKVDIACDGIGEDGVPINAVLVQS